MLRMRPRYSYVGASSLENSVVCLCSAVKSNVAFAHHIRLEVLCCFNAIAVSYVPFCLVPGQVCLADLGAARHVLRVNWLSYRLPMYLLLCVLLCMLLTTDQCRFGLPPSHCVDMVLNGEYFNGCTIATQERRPDLFLSSVCCSSCRMCIAKGICDC